MQFTVSIVGISLSTAKSQHLFCKVFVSGKSYGSDEKSNKLLQHQRSLMHAESVAAYAHYQDVKSGAFQSVPTLHNQGYSKLVQDNRHYLKAVCEVLLLTAQQKIAQCETGRSFCVGDIDVQGLDFGPSCGNFLAILALLAKHDPIVAEKICLGPKNAKYTDHSIQNAILDVSKKEQVVIAVCYCHQNVINEEFIGIAEAHELNAEGLSDTII